VVLVSVMGPALGLRHRGEFAGVTIYQEDGPQAMRPVAKTVSSKLPSTSC